MHFHCILICIGDPKDHLRLDSLAAGTFLLVGKDDTICSEIMFIPLQQTNHIFGILGIVLGARY